MSLSKAPDVKITYRTAQEISDEILGGVIQFCKSTGYKRNMKTLTFFWCSFLFTVKNTLDENGILNDTLKCFTNSMGRVFPKVFEDDQYKESVISEQQHYWNQLLVGFVSSDTNTEIIPLIKMADEMNDKCEDSVTDQIRENIAKAYKQYSSTINSNVDCILHDIDNGMSIQYKNLLHNFVYAKTEQSTNVSVSQPPKSYDVGTEPNETTTSEKTLGMAWYKFLVYFGLIAGAILNIIYSFSYISGGVYFIESNGVISADQVYSRYGTGLQIVDILYGCFLIAFAIFAFILRHKLAKLKSDSLNYIVVFYSSFVAVPLLYSVVVSVITRESLSVSAVTTALFGLAFLILNINYFKKRAHLFVNEAVMSRSRKSHEQGLTSETKSKKHTITILILSAIIVLLTVAIVILIVKINNNDNLSAYKNTEVVQNTNDSEMYLNSKGTMIVGVEAECYPYSWKENGNFYGLNVDVAKALALRNGYSVEFVETSWEDLFIGVEEGTYNLVLGIEPTKDRQEAYEDSVVGFTDVYYDNMAALYNISELDMSFDEWMNFRNTIKEMWDDGTMELILSKYDLGY